MDKNHHWFKKLILFNKFIFQHRTKIDSVMIFNVLTRTRVHANELCVMQNEVVQNHQYGGWAPLNLDGDS